VEVNAAGTASVVATPGLSPSLFNPFGEAVDAQSDLFIADSGNNRIVEVNAAGTASVVATPGLSLALFNPSGVAVDAQGDLFIADTGNNQIVEVQTSLPVTKASQTISFTAPTSPITFVSNETVPLNASGGASGNAVVFSIDGSSTGTGSISGTTLTVTGLGSIVIDANQAGDSNYNAAAQVQQTLVANQGSQTVTFGPLSPVTFGVAPLMLSATSSSGLAVTYSVLSGPGSISGTTLTVTGAGSILVQANQAGNDNDASGTVTDSIGLALSGLLDWTVKRPYTPIVTATGGTGPYTFTLASGALPTGLTFNANGTFSGAPTATGPFTFTLQASQGTSASGTRTYTVNIHAVPTISNLTVTQWIVGQSGFTGTMTIANGTPQCIIVGKPTGVPPGLTAVLSGNTISFTGTPSKAGTFKGKITIRDLAGDLVTKTFAIKINLH
jgi:hypothetical protein